MARSEASPFALGVALISPFTEHNFLFEILDHAGLAYTAAADEASPESISGCRVWLIVCHKRDGVGDDWAKGIRAHAQSGGGLVFVGNPLGLEDLLGVTIAPGDNQMNLAWLGSVVSLGEGFAELSDDLSAVVQYERPLHFFGGAAVQVTSGQSFGKALGRHLEHRRLDWGSSPAPNITGIYADLAGTVRRITHGIPVASDGVPAPDGSAPIDDNILKAEDGLVLDWQHDRSAPDDLPFSFFADPIADCWREILLWAVFRTASALGAPLRMLWYYPDSLKSIGHISFDTDGSDPALAHKLLDVLADIDLPTTWFVIAPGYPSDSGVISRAKQQGVEIGFHFDGGITQLSKVDEWSIENFKIQLAQVAAACEVDGFRSNKNHYTRWQNSTDVPEWCAGSGIVVDESRLPSKPGTLGFFSGTSHPWYPHDQAGRQIDCLEIAGLSQDPIVTVPVQALLTLLERADAHCGIASFTFHPAHIAKPGVADALALVVETGRKQGLEWWTAEQVAEWESARRAAGFKADGALATSGIDFGRTPQVFQLDESGQFEYLGFWFA